MVLIYIYIYIYILILYQEGVFESPGLKTEATAWRGEEIQAGIV